MKEKGDEIWRDRYEIIQSQPLWAFWIHGVLQRNWRRRRKDLAELWLVNEGAGKLGKLDLISKSKARERINDGFQKLKNKETDLSNYF